MPLDIALQAIMTNQQLEEHSQQLETRVATLEKELVQVKQSLAESLKKKEPWWLKVAGSFEDDPTFDEAVRLGQEWRKSSSSRD
jgi:phosphoenolpyruvate-protein kinase (PTS system EI component)